MDPMESLACGALFLAAGWTALAYSETGHMPTWPAAPRLRGSRFGVLRGVLLATAALVILAGGAAGLAIITLTGLCFALRRVCRQDTGQARIAPLRIHHPELDAFKTRNSRPDITDS